MPLTTLEHQRLLHAGDSTVPSSCPVCFKSFRQTSYSTTLIRSIRSHIRSVARTESASGTQPHLHFLESQSRLRCPVPSCLQQFDAASSLWAHFIDASDAAHSAFKQAGAQRRSHRTAAPLTALYKERLLYASAKANDADTVHRLLYVDDVAADAGGEDGFTPLMTAAEAGHANIVRMLLDRGAAANAQNRYGQTALSLAAQNGRLGTVQRLLRARGVDVALRGNAGMNAAQVARAAGHAQVADAIARHDRPKQVGALLDAAMDEGMQVQNDFDSMEQRLAALFTQTGASLPSAVNGGDEDDEVCMQDEDDEEEEEEEADAGMACAVCLFKKVNVALVPCWHAQYCAECAQSLDECAICRTKITFVQRIFLP